MSATDPLPPPLPVIVAGSAPSIGRRFPCERCGAKLEYQPGTRNLACSYCGFENTIAASHAAIEELEYAAYLERAVAGAEQRDATLVRCSACAAEVEKPETATALACPYCGADMVMAAQSRRVIKPQALLPFRITAAQSREQFRSWLRRRWFAPSALKRMARLETLLRGVYVPYWTYDCRTMTRYQGARGDNYIVTIWITVNVNGRTEQRPQQVVRTRWTPVSGSVRNRFDDLLIVASRALPRRHVERIDPWDLHALVAYDDAYLSGFLAQSYQVNLPEGFEYAKQLMSGPIHASVISDIGGDHQRIHSLDIDYQGITFKHVLLPIWISAYRYRDKVFQFLVNARTGEVHGDRPWSWVKITCTALAAAAAVAGLVYVLQQA